MLGDFGLVGTMYGHLARDPWPARELVVKRPHLRAWTERMAAPEHAQMPAGAQGLLPNDQIAPTLEPVFQAIAHEFLPLLEGILAQLQKLREDWPEGKPLPRRLADVEVPMGQGRFIRAALPYSLWMAQRTLDAFARMSPLEQAQVRQWLRTLGGERLLDLDIPRLSIHGVRVALESQAPAQTTPSSSLHARS